MLQEKCTENSTVEEFRGPDSHANPSSCHLTSDKDVYNKYVSPV